MGGGESGSLSYDWAGAVFGSVVMLGEEMGDVGRPVMVLEVRAALAAKQKERKISFAHLKNSLNTLNDFS